MAEGARWPRDRHREAHHHPPSLRRRVLLLLLPGLLLIAVSLGGPAVADRLGVGGEDDPQGAAPTVTRTPSHEPGHLPRA